MSVRVRSTFVASLLMTLILAVPATARGEHVVDDAALSGAAARTMSTERFEWATLAEFVSRDDVQRATSRLGVDPRTVESAVAGDPKVTPSLTALLLINLLVVWIADWEAWEA